MPYYGDHYTGDPGLFRSLGRIARGIGRFAARAAPVLLGAAPVIAGLGIVRGLGGAGRSSQPAKGVVARTQEIRNASASPAVGLSAIGRRVAVRRRVSPFALRQAAARRARLRARGYRVR